MTNSNEFKLLVWQCVDFCNKLISVDIHVLNLTVRLHLCVSR